MTGSAPTWDDPIDLLVVASWFPAYDDPAAGRFVADQTEAVAATGAVRPAVISFEGVRLTGGARSRAVQAEAVREAAIAGLRAASPIFVAPAWAVDPALPVARLTVPEGLTRPAGAAHAVVHREAILQALAERLGTVGKGIVHAHTVYPDGAAAVVLADELGSPLVITEHASFVERIVATPARRERYEAALSRAHSVLAVSEMLARELRTLFPDHATKIAVHPNAVAVEEFRSRPLEERVADQLLFVGYRKETKGIENLLRATAIAHRRRPAITLRLIGRSLDEATEMRWVELAAELGITEIVTFGQSMDRAAVAEAMSRASLFVHPSPRETFGVVAVEALASGLPIVATDSGGVSEVLGPEPDRLGAVVAIDDPDALAGAIVRTLERRASFDPAALRASVEFRFGAAVVAEGLLATYRSALASHTAPAAAAPQGLGTAALPDRTLIVALDRARAAEHLGRLPNALLARLDVVTSIEPSAVSMPPVRRVTGVAIDAVWRVPDLPGGHAQRQFARRLARFARNPMGTVLGRLGRGAGSSASLRPATEAIRRLVAGDSASLDILPLDGHDFLAVAPLIAKDIVRPPEGGLRRLADNWHAAASGEPGRGSGD